MAPEWHGWDFFLELMFDKATLQEAVARSLDVESPDVLLVDGDEELSESFDPEEIRVFVRRHPVKGDVLCWLDLNYDRRLGEKDLFEMARRLCSFLNVRAVVPDDSTYDPFALTGFQFQTEVSTYLHKEALRG